MLNNASFATSFIMNSVTALHPSSKSVLGHMIVQRVARLGFRFSSVSRVCRRRAVTNKLVYCVFLTVIFSSSFVIFFISGIFNVCSICLSSMFRIVLALHLWRKNFIISSTPHGRRLHHKAGAVLSAAAGQASRRRSGHGLRWIARFDHACGQSCLQLIDRPAGSR